MNRIKNHSFSYTHLIDQFESEEGPFFGNKDKSPLFPNLLTVWSRVAVFVLAGSIVLLVLFEIFWSFQAKEAQVSKPTQTFPSFKTGETNLAPFLTLVSDLKKREIFKIYETPGQKTVPVLPQVDIRQATANLVLSGVIFEEEPQAIIEDKKKNKTYILKSGDYIENIKVESVQRGKVRLRLESQTIDLEL